MKKEEKIRLHLGCGDMILPGWINVDLFCELADIQADVRKLPFPDNYADEIYSSHVIEHFNFKEAFEVLREWNRVLKPGGTIMIETPDMLASCKKFVESSDEYRIANLYPHFFSEPWRGSGFYHLFLYTETQLRWTLEQCGFKNCQRQFAPRYIGKEDICLGMKAEK